MAIPRVFISSTYYDLKYVRNEIEQFIKSLGYDPVMHDKGKVAYTQEVTLEESCYNELSQCDIIISIIGGRYGTQSQGSDYSITMTELERALVEKKKIYVFISKDVYIENGSYEANKDGGNYKPAYANDIRVHEYISELKAKIKNQPIKPFDNTSEIIDELKVQFAGLFQRLLREQATLTETKTAYDLQQSADDIKAAAQEFHKEKEEFFKKFDGSIMSTNAIVRFIGKKIGLKKSMFFAKDYAAIDDFLIAIGFSTDNFDFEDEYIYTRIMGDTQQTLTLSAEIFDAEKNLKDLRSIEKIEELVIYNEKSVYIIVDDAEDLPF